MAKSTNTTGLESLIKRTEKNLKKLEKLGEKLQDLDAALKAEEAKREKSKQHKPN